MKRTIKITTKSINLSEVLNNLNFSDDFKNNAVFSLDLEIEPNEDTYKYLAETDKILDWEFVDEEENLDTIIIDKFNIKNYEDIVHIIYLIWKNKKEEPNKRSIEKTLKEIYPLFEIYKDKYESFDSNIFIVSKYYNNLEIDKIIINDFLEKLKNNWNIFSNNDLEFDELIDKLF